MRGKSNTPSFKEMEREAWHQKAPDYHDHGGQVITQAIGRLLDAVRRQRARSLTSLGLMRWTHQGLNRVWE
jgi:hypothetical protein